MTAIEKLPEELLLCILEHVDNPAPSTLKNRHEPSLELTSSHVRPYKEVSLVSQRWRRIVLPLLFKFSRLRLHVSPESHWLACEVCGERSEFRQGSSSLPSNIDAHHAALFKHARAVGDGIAISCGTSEEKLAEDASLQWAGRFYHCLKDFLVFVQANQLSSSIHSFVLMTDQTYEQAHVRFPHQDATTKDHRYRASAELWHHLFSVIDPARVVLVAPPSDMAALTNSAIDRFGAWAFSDMNFHILEVSTQKQGDVSTAGPAHPSALDFSELSYEPQGFPGVAESSILNMRSWSHLALNEGSFLKAYGTYEYFERGPPSLIFSIKSCIASNTQDSPSRPKRRTKLEHLRSVTYTALLPFAGHLDFRAFLPYIDELDVMIAPGPDSNILNDKSRVGKAELADCWQEFSSAYHVITRPFRTFDIQPDGMPKLQRFVCRDLWLPALQEDLDHVFVPLCLPVWAEMEPGVFVRQQAGPPEHLWNG
ncbi:Hypothetical predicted protein [Lecanosticta acicola]|uniref:F-box domain-containing protein n=1 Tax=Lecanosticta acicola TaxID=111012 RepID=A0AAI8YUK1_9PEZI|nr:Hypothetical predicted protein [Lecanosticta acicola]